jgi:hypothetical protein
VNHKTIAIVVFVIYGLLSYGMGFVKPRKCSDHETADDRYKAAVRAPFTTIIAMSMTVGIIWAVQVVFFQ